MTRRKLLSVLPLIIGLSLTCNSFAKNTTVPDNSQIAHLKQDAFPLTGTFRWTFYLGPFEQVSTHLFTTKYIDYQMRGKIHSTDYRMQQLSYDTEQKKWIGKTTDGIVYAIFFKDITANQLTIYKRKCEQGLEEAIALQRPADDTTADHGWNVYTREGIAEGSDNLAFSDTFVSPDNQQLILSDNRAEWQGKTYQKLTHHAGERRWVGQQNSQYLVVFYDYVDGASQGKFAVKVVNDIEKAYQLKYDQQTFTAYQVK